MGSRISLALAVASVLATPSPAPAQTAAPTQASEPDYSWPPRCITRWMRDGTARVLCRNAIPRRHVDVGVAVEEVHTLSSEYNTALQAWGYGGFTDLARVSVRVSLSPVDWFQFGIEAGYSSSGAGRATFDNAELNAELYDVVAVVRALYEWSGYSGTTGRFGIELQGGTAYVRTYLRGAETGDAVARLAGVVFIGVAPDARWPALVARIGYQWVPYGGAGVGSTDPVFSGPVVGVGLEWPR